MKRLFLLATILALMFTMTINAIENLPQDADDRKNPVTDILDWPEGAAQQSNLYRNWAGESLAPAGDMDGYSHHPPRILDFSYAGYRQGNTPIPKVVTTRTINVTDYGAIPNDGNDDTQAIRDCFADVTDGTMVLFPPGEFIVFKDEGGTHLEIASASNVIIQGSGAQGVRDGGTTIYQGHPQIKYDDDGNSESFRSGGIFRMAKKSGSAVHSNLTDEHTFTLQKINYLNVDNPERFIGKKFVKLGVKNGYTVNPHDDADDNVYVDGILNVDTPKLYHWKHNMGIWRYDEMPESWETINTGLHLHEFHEIDHVDTLRNRIYLKTPVMNSYSRANHQVSSKEYNEDVGFQDLHFDCGYNVPWDHDKKERQGYYGRNAINMSGLANSWVKRVRISNSTSGIEYGGTCNISIIGVVFDGNAGHYSIVGAGASHAFIGLIQEYDNKAHHGISVQGGTSGIVMWGIGGPDQTMHGPDAHGWQPSYTLMDNYYSNYHQSSGVAYDNRPNHLLGYIRYNNRATSSVSTFDGMEWSQINIPWSADSWEDFWSSVKTAAKMIEKGNLTFHQTGGFQTMQGIISGFKSGANPVDWEFVEGWNNYVSPKSLYVAQLTHRHDGVEPFWVEQEIGEYDEWFDIVMNGERPPSGYIITENTDPVFSEDSKTFSIAEHAENAIEGDEKERILALSNLNDNGNQLIDDPFGDPVIARDTTNYILRYTLQNAAGMFTVDTYTGQLKIAGRLDYETATSHTFTLKVDDFFNGEDTIEITVNVLDIPERHAPTFEGDNNVQMNIKENMPIGTNIGDPVVAEVIGDETITYSIIHNDQYFSVDSATGQVKSNYIFDYEALAEGDTGYRGIVRATEPTGLTSYESHNFFVTIIDMPEFSQSSKTFRIMSNVEDRHRIGEPITAEYSGTLSYTLSGDDVDSFRMNSRTAQLILDTTLDVATKDQYSLVVTATSDEGYTDQIDITVNIQDILEGNLGLEFRESVQGNLSIMENSFANTRIGEWFSVNNEVGDVVYTLEGLDTEIFSINTNGQLKLKTASLDYETQDIYTFSVVATDSENQRVSKVVTINILDENGNIFTERSPIVQAAIIANLNVLGISKTAENITNEDLSSVSGNLFINFGGERRELSKLREGDLDGLTNCSSLYLTTTTLTSLPDRLFSDLTNLTSLSLADNMLDNIQAGIFDGLRKLERFSLSKNKIKRLPEGIFDDLVKVWSFGMDSNPMGDIPQNLFERMRSLRYVDLADMGLRTIDLDLFSGQKDIRGLTLSRNQLRALPRKLCDKYNDIWSLYLYDNNLTELPQGFFNGTTDEDSRLAIIRLEGNPVDPIPISLYLEKFNNGRFKLRVREGAPFTIRVNLAITNGTLPNSSTRITIPKGSDSSDKIRVVGNDEGEVVIDITEDLPSIPDRHDGYELRKQDNFAIVFSDIAVPSAVIPTPDSTALFANFPNPFNPETWIPYQLVKPSRVNITIFNSRGVVVRDLDLGIKSAGYYLDRNNAAHWDGLNTFGERVSSGIYLYHFRTNTLSVIRKMVILK